MTAVHSIGFIDTDGGRFRVIEWPGAEPATLFLHGLTAVAESWAPTVGHLEPSRRSIAFDQRGHGLSTDHLPDPSAGALAADAAAIVNTLGLERPHLVGHSMGARVAIVAAARYPELFRSVAIVDIGPEAWRQNWVDTVAALDRQSDVLRAGQPESVIARRGFGPDMAAAFMARFERHPDGSYRALGSREAMKDIVRTQRAQNYWREWEALKAPLLLVRGGESDEVRPRIAESMRSRNPSATFVEIPGVGHNIPLLDPGALAATLSAFWKSAE